MPQYVYTCQDCRRRFSVLLTFAEYGVKAVVCTHCGSQKVQRRIGRVRVAKSSESRLSAMADPALLDSVDDNPQALGRMMRELSAETGEEMPAEFDEVVDRLERGQTPDEIERDVPELGEGE